MSRQRGSVSKKLETGMMVLKIVSTKHTPYECWMVILREEVISCAVVLTFPVVTPSSCSSTASFGLCRGIREMNVKEIKVFPQKLIYEDKSEGE